MEVCLLTGEKQYKLDELMPIYQEMLNSKSSGTAAEFNEAFKTFDREGQGFVSSAELRHCLSAMGQLWRCNRDVSNRYQLMNVWLSHTGDRLSDEEMDEILRFTETEEDIDGNVKYGGKCSAKSSLVSWYRRQAV